MKTKKLIELLQEADPTGEEECCVGNTDIHFVGVEPAYYDGRLQVLERDESNEYYNITGGQYRMSGSKVVIHELSITDAVWNDPDLPVEFDYEPSESELKNLENTRNEVKEFRAKQLKYWTEKIVKKYNEGWKAWQSVDREIGSCLGLHWFKDEPEDGDLKNNLCIGECGAIEDSGLFKVVQEGDRCIWHLKGEEE